MNRLQKKCLLGSTLGHGLLLLVLIACMAFKGGEPKNSTPPVIELLNISDGPSRTPGPVNVAPPPMQGAAQPAPEPEQPKAQLKPVEPEPVSEVAKIQPEEIKPQPKAEIPIQPKKTTSKPDLRPVTRTDGKKTNEPKIALKPVTRNPNGSKTSNRSTQSSTRDVTRQRDVTRDIGSAISAIRGGDKTVTSVQIAGDGSAGAAMANYRDLVAHVYQNNYDSALISAGEIADGDASVDVAVTIERSGRVISGRITNPSGNANLDRLVRKVLDRVQFIAPFPESSKDSQRNFNISFDLKAKRLAGR